MGNFLAQKAQDIPADRGVGEGDKGDMSPPPENSHVEKNWGGVWLKNYCNCY